MPPAQRLLYEEDPRRYHLRVITQIKDAGGLPSADNSPAVQRDDGEGHIGNRVSRDVTPVLLMVYLKKLHQCCNSFE